MTTELKTRRFPEWMAAAPWLAFLLIGGVFFYTGHDIKRSSYILERGVEEFNPTAEEAEVMLEQYQTGSAGKAIAYLILGAFGGIVLLNNLMQRRLSINGLLGGIALTYALWSMMSLLWADDRMITLNKVIILALLCLTALAVSQIFREEDFLLFALSCTAAYLIIGVGAEIVLGAFRPWVAGYRFSGTLHPNGQGLNCALLFLSAFYMRRVDEPRKRLWTVITFLAIVFLFLTRSRTPIGLVVITLFLFWAMRAPLTHKVFLVALAGFVVCAILVLGDTLFPALQEAMRFGRTDVLETGGGTTFKGRLDLWQACWPFITDHFLLGTGYSSFWTANNTFDLADEAGWIAGSAHSIYVDNLLGLGIIGFILFLCMFALAIGRLSQSFALQHKPIHAFLITLLLFSLAHGLLESTFIFPGIYSFLCMSIIALLAFRAPQESAETAALLPAKGRALAAAASPSPRA